MTGPFVSSPVRNALMSELTHTRRRFVAGAAGTALSLGFAGCSVASSAEQESPHGGGRSDQHDEGPDHSGAESGEAPGHSEQEHGHGSVPSPSDLAEVAVNTTDDGQAHFAPHVTRVTVGGTVRWVLESGTHTATAYHPGNDEPRLVPKGTDAWDSGTLSEQGETFEHAFETEGVYHYYCVPHETQGMIATVIVGEPDPHEQVAVQDLPAEKPAGVRAKLSELNGMIRSALGDDHEKTESGDHHDETETDHHGDSDDHHGS